MDESEVIGQDDVTQVENETESPPPEASEEEEVSIPKIDLTGVLSHTENYEEYEKKPKEDPEFVNIESMMASKQMRKKSTGRKTRRRRKRRLLSKKEANAHYRRDLPERKSWAKSSSSFRSDSKRMSYVKGSDTPAPGEYKVDVMSDKSTFGLSSMRSGTPRFSSGAQKEAAKVPCPGHYKIKSERSKSLGFFPSSKRFSGSRHKTPSSTTYSPMKSFHAINNKKIKIHSPFRSESKRFGRRRKIKTPVQYGVSKSMEMKGGRFSRSARFSGRRFSTPPPGSYFTKFYENFSKKRISHSFTQGRRFRKLKKDSSPGPGNYLSSELPESVYIPYKK